MNEELTLDVKGRFADGSGECLRKAVAPLREIIA
jgi:hypothetical protein